MGIIQVQLFMLIFRTPGNSVIWDLILFTKFYLLFQISFSIITSSLVFSDPFFVNQIIKSIENLNYEYPIWLVFGMFALALLKTIIDSQLSLNSRHWLNQMKTILVTEIFKKSLRRFTFTYGDGKKNARASQGRIVSLMGSGIYF